MPTHLTTSGISLHSNCSTIFTKLFHRKIKCIRVIKFSSVVIKPSRFLPLGALALNNPSTRRPQGLSQVQVDTSSCHSSPSLSQVLGLQVAREILTRHGRVLTRASLHVQVFSYSLARAGNFSV